jgi:hypothetical protein
MPPYLSDYSLRRFKYNPPNWVPYGSSNFLGGTLLFGLSLDYIDLYCGCYVNVVLPFNQTSDVPRDLLPPIRPNKTTPQKMETQTLRISPFAFASAVQELPLSAVYAKAAELRNSISHLHRSNAELRAFLAESLDPEEEKKELEGYIAENEDVIASMNARIALLRAEIERRGQSWVEDEEKDGDADGNAQRLAENPPAPNGDQGQDQEAENGVYL